MYVPSSYIMQSFCRIYPHFSKTSLGYCGGVAAYWPKSIFGSKLTCLALCEIVDKKDDFTTYPGSKNFRSNDGIYVVPREDLVRDNTKSITR